MVLKYVTCVYVLTSQDIFEIHFAVNADYDPKKEKEVGKEDSLHSPFECPITHLPVNGTHKYAVTSQQLIVSSGFLL